DQIVEAVEQVLFDRRVDGDDLLEIGEDVRRSATGRLDQKLLHHVVAVREGTTVDGDVGVLGVQVVAPLLGELILAGDAVQIDDLAAHLGASAVRLRCGYGGRGCRAGWRGG